MLKAYRFFLPTEESHNDYGLWGLVDCEGNLVLQPSYRKIGGWHQTSDKIHFALVESFDGKVGVIDQSGKLIIPTIYIDAFQFYDDLIAVKNDSGKWGVADFNGLISLPFHFDDLFPMNTGLAIAQQGEHEFYINKFGEPVLHGIYAYIDNFSNDGLAAAQSAESDLFGYINCEGKFIIQPSFIDAQRFVNGAAAVSIEVENSQKWGLINPQGNWIVDAEYNDFETNNLAGLFLFLDEHESWVVLNSEGHELHKEDYWKPILEDSSRSFYVNGYLEAKHYNFSKGEQGMLPIDDWFSGFNGRKSGVAISGRETITAIDHQGNVIQSLHNVELLVNFIDDTEEHPPRLIDQTLTWVPMITKDGALIHMNCESGKIVMSEIVNTKNHQELRVSDHTDKVLWTHKPHIDLLVLNPPNYFNPDMRDHGFKESWNNNIYQVVDELIHTEPEWLVEKEGPPNFYGLDDAEFEQAISKWGRGATKQLGRYEIGPPDTQKYTFLHSKKPNDDLYQKVASQLRDKYGAPEQGSELRHFYAVESESDDCDYNIWKLDNGHLVLSNSYSAYHLEELTVSWQLTWFPYV